MARPKSATHDFKRDEILDIAALCFAQSSYPAASMNTIAAAGGTSKARLYHYYDSNCLLYTSPSPRDRQKSRMPSSA